jgi:hypothetical protein
LLLDFCSSAAYWHWRRSCCGETRSRTSPPSWAHAWR